MRPEDAFDAVLMLTWSDWKIEPRSNRYHYASRFARRMPVLFVQPSAAPGTPIAVEPSEIPGLDIVHAPYRLDGEGLTQFKQVLRDRGIRRPLLWISNSLHFRPLIDALPGALRVFHATEDYLTPSVGWTLNREHIAESVHRLLLSIDLLVAVSEVVLASYRAQGDDKLAIVVGNGCDAAFFFELLDVGVGLGRVLGPFTEYERYGIDISLDYLRAAKAAGFDVAYSRIEDMPYRDGTFDAVVACDVLEHVLDLFACTKAMLRVLHPGGSLIVRVPYLDDLDAYPDPSTPYAFIHLRSFDLAALRLHFERIIGCVFVEQTMVAPYLKGLLA